MAERESERPIPLVGIIMGSKSDWETMQNAADTLDKVDPAHAWHCHIEDQAVGLIQRFRPKKILWRRKRAGSVAEFMQQIGKRLPHGLIVINDRHERTFDHRISHQVQLALRNPRPRPARSSAHRRLRRVPF